MGVGAHVCVKVQKNEETGRKQKHTRWRRLIRYESWDGDLTRDVAWTLDGNFRNSRTVPTARLTRKWKWVNARYVRAPWDSTRYQYSTIPIWDLDA